MSEGTFCCLAAAHIYVGHTFSWTPSDDILDQRGNIDVFDPVMLLKKRTICVSGT